VPLADVADGLQCGGPTVKQRVSLLAESPRIITGIPLTVTVDPEAINAPEP
jgi:hypothetical protein